MNFANGAVTTLSADITAGAGSLIVADASRFPAAPFHICIDSELMTVTVKFGSVFTVTRGIEGTIAAAHTAAALVTNIVTAGDYAGFASPALTVGNAVSGGSANAVLYEDAAQKLAAVANLQYVNGGLVVQATAGGQFGINIKNTLGNTTFSIGSDSGTIFTNASVDTSVAFRLLAFGAFVGVLAGSRFVFNGLSIQYFNTLEGHVSDAVTTTITTALSLNHNTSGTAAAGFGEAIVFNLDSSTTADRPAAEIDVVWANATDATRKGRLSVGAHDSGTSAGAPREGFRVESDGAQALVGFYAVAAIARATLSTGVGHTVDDVITALQNLGLVKQ